MTLNSNTATPTEPAPFAGVDRFRSTQSAARAVQSAMYLYFAVAAVDLSATILRLTLLGRLQAEGAGSGNLLTELPAEVSDQTIDFYNGTLASLSSLTMWGLVAATIVVAVFFLRWLVFARRNAPLLGVVGVRYSTVSGVLCWFVPFWSLFGPKQVVNDLWIGSDPEAPLPVNVRQRPVPGWLLAWWLPHILVAFGSLVASTGADTIGAAQTSEYWWLAASVLEALSGIVLIHLVNKIASRQVERAASLGIITD